MAANAKSADDTSTSEVVSTSPFTTLANLDPTKKYTLIFLLSVGTTLLVTGASGGRLLKRAQKMTAEPTTSPTLKSSLQLRSTISTAPLSALPIVPHASSSTSSAHRQSSINASTSTLPSPRTTRIPSIALLDLATSFPPLSSPHHRSLLRQWSKDKGSDLSFWLPNSTLLEESTAAALASEMYDKQGIGYGDELNIKEDAVDDGFNPAVYGAKAFAIATALTFSIFGLAIGGVMKWYGVSDVRTPARNLNLSVKYTNEHRFEQLESLSLSLSHSLPTALEARRPSVPEWALPAAKAVIKPGEEEDSIEHKEGVAYWVDVKETLDREAEEDLRARRQKWEELQLRLKRV
jgi:hypothetical protein